MAVYHPLLRLTKKLVMRQHFTVRTFIFNYGGYEGGRQETITIFHRFYLFFYWSILLPVPESTMYRAYNNKVVI